MKSEPPNSYSRSWMALVSVGCEIEQRFAARVKLSSSHSTRKY